MQHVDITKFDKYSICSSWFLIKLSDLVKKMLLKRLNMMN